MTTKTRIAGCAAVIGLLDGGIVCNPPIDRRIVPNSEFAA
jgi:hypothetical protein